MILAEDRLASTEEWCTVVWIDNPPRQNGAKSKLQCARVWCSACRAGSGDGMQVSPCYLPSGRRRNTYRGITHWIRSHAICPGCANNHGFSGQAPYTCPICSQPLSASEVCEQLLQPSEEWKSVALSGLGPTVVMECAGRALSFWSYQMTNQMSVPFHTKPGWAAAYW